jgi:2-polyprenyl-3-methyl-5-hydroxy-6-metoxy-1,4-benzoquinol methylase
VERALIERFLRKIAALAAEGNPVAVLDAGCGEGFVSERLRPVAAELTGIDLRERAIAEAGRRVPDARFAVGDVCELPFEDGAFDLVVCTEVLEHLDEPRAALGELVRVSRGRVLVTVPHEPFFRLGNLARGRHVRRLGSTPGHRWTWTRRGLLGLLPDARWFSAFPWQGALLYTKSVSRTSNESRAASSAAWAVSAAP